MGNDGDILHASREQIDRIQLAGIQKTVIDVYEHIPLYKKSFDEAGFDPSPCRSRTFARSTCLRARPASRPWAPTPSTT